MAKTMTIQFLEKRLASIKKELKAQGISDTQIKQMPIMLGDDEELNGVHEMYYCDIVDKTNEDWNCVYGVSKSDAIDNKFILIS